MAISGRIGVRTILASVLVILVLLLSITGIWLFNQIYNSQRQTISDLTAENNQLQDQVYDLAADNHLLEYEVNDLTDDLVNALNLSKQVGIFGCNACPQHAGEKEGFGFFEADYPGYVTVSLTAEGITNGSYAAIEVDYTYSNQFFNFTKTYDADPLGNPVGGTYIVPVLPSNVSIWIGNTNSIVEPTMRFDINYYF